MGLPQGFEKTIIKSKKPLVSVIIPAYNEETDIEECLKSIKKQTYKKIEVIVVDDGSTDNTISIVSRFKEVRLIKQNHQGPGAARNLAAKNAKGEILVLIDADMILFPDYVENLILPIIKNQALGTIESIQVNIHQTKMQECWGKEVRTVQLEGVNSSTVRGIAKNDFIQLGGFDKKYGYADDRTFFLKYGIRFLILPDVKCYHKTPKTIKGVYRQSIWIGASLEKGLLKYPLIRKIAPALMVLISPIAIPLLALRKCLKDSSFKLLIPWMIIFMAARYFGTISGILKRNILNKNTR
jgi:glycosyltransferase involved in cell wall biosynthesis